MLITQEKLHFSLICSFYCCLVKEGWVLKVVHQFAIWGLAAFRRATYKKINVFSFCVKIRNMSWESITCFNKLNDLQDKWFDGLCWLWLCLWIVRQKWDKMLKVQQLMSLKHSHRENRVLLFFCFCYSLFSWLLFIIVQTPPLHKRRVLTSSNLAIRAGM